MPAVPARARVAPAAWHIWPGRRLGTGGHLPRRRRARDDRRPARSRV